MKLFPLGLRWVWIAVGAVITVLVLGLWEQGRTAERAAVPVTPLGEWDTDPAVWGRYFPREYQSWLKAREPAVENIGYGPGRTKWGGPESTRQDDLPLFAGYSFAEGRSQVIPGHPVGCQACHDPATMELRVSQPGFLADLGPAKLSRQDLKTYVCAQCHVARKEGAKPRIPFTAEGLLSWSGEGGPTDWIHAASGAPMLRIRHAEFELWSQGSHAQHGVSCVDCHMPYLPEGSARITSHRMQSPMLDVASSCAGCHRWGEKEIRARVEAIQDTTMDLERRAAEALRLAHETVALARKAGVPDEQLKASRALIRQAQARWDFIASERSAGFHAPQEATIHLGTAMDLARQAANLAQQSRSRAQ